METGVCRHYSMNNSLILFCFLMTGECWNGSPRKKTCFYPDLDRLNGLLPWHSDINTNRKAQIGCYWCPGHVPHLPRQTITFLYLVFVFWKKTSHFKWLVSVGHLWQQFSWFCANHVTSWLWHKNLDVTEKMSQKWCYTETWCLQPLLFSE